MRSGTLPERRSGQAEAGAVLWVMAAHGVAAGRGSFSSLLLTKPRVVPLLGLLVAGAACGALAKAADESGTDWLGGLGTRPGTWIFALALISRYAPTGGGAALRVTAFFVAMTGSYYAWAAFILGFPDPGRQAAVWGLISLTLVPAIGSVLWWGSRQRGVLNGVVVATAAGAVLSDRPVMQAVRTAFFDADLPVDLVGLAVSVGLAATVALLLPRHGLTRACAAALVVPAAAASAGIFDSVSLRLLSA